MSHRLIPFSLIEQTRQKRVENAGAKRREREKRKTPQFFYDFFMMGKSIKIIVLFFSESDSLGSIRRRNETIATFNTINNLLNFPNRKLENFHLEKFSISFSLTEHTSGEMGNWSQQKFNSDWTVMKFIECRYGKNAVEVNFSAAQSQTHFPDSLEGCHAKAAVD